MKKLLFLEMTFLKNNILTKNYVHKDFSFLGLHHDQEFMTFRTEVFILLVLHVVFLITGEVFVRMFCDLLSWFKVIWGLSFRFFKELWDDSFKGFF